MIWAPALFKKKKKKKSHMFISIDTEKPFVKIQHLFVIKLSGN